MAASETTLYLVVWHDRHQDDEYALFSDSDKALAYAKRLARKQLCGNNRELNEEMSIYMTAAGWLYYGCYQEEEGDYVLVRPVTYHISCDKGNGQ